MFKEPQTYGYWTLLERLPGYRAKCQCICGIVKIINVRNLIKGKTKSCGCKKIDCSIQTCIEKYNTTNPRLILGVGEKIKKIIKDKYGVENVFQAKSIKQKIKETHLKKREVEYPTQSKEVQEKIKTICLEKYGTSNVFASKEIQKKIKETNLQKYGVENYTQTEECQQKITKTNIARYGVKTLTQSPARRNNLKDWCEEHPGHNGTSKAELEILTWIQKYFPNAKKYKTKHELDIFIPELNLGIEHNGLYRHSELFKETNYHLNKTKHFKKLNIKTIHIWECEWKHKQEQVKSFLLSAINKNEHKIGARKCKVVWSNSKDEIKAAHDLLDSTHIQGHTNSTKYVANVYYNDELLATATFGKHHRNSKDWVLSRFTTKINYTIQGILSKISKLASKELKSDIISWADYRLSTGNGYEKAGWKFEELLPPDYFYWKNGTSSLKGVLSKQSRQKKLVNTPKDMTEHQHALQDDLLRIYDCGKIRYRYNFKGDNEEVCLKN